MQQTSAEMILILAFFFLLQPGGYTSNATNADAHPFLLENVQLFLIGLTHQRHLLTATVAQQLI
jgi:hypothetical protein